MSRPALIFIVSWLATAPCFSKEQTTSVSLAEWSAYGGPTARWDKGCTVYGTGLVTGHDSANHYSSQLLEMELSELRKLAFQIEKAPSKMLSTDEAKGVCAYDSLKVRNTRKGVEILFERQGCARKYLETVIAPKICKILSKYCKGIDCITPFNP